MTEIVPLGLHHEVVLAEFLADFLAAEEHDIPGYFGSPNYTHEEQVCAFEAQARGAGLSPGLVPSTTLFLFENEQMVGVVNYRHSLNDNLRRLGGHVGYSVAPSFRKRGHATRLLCAALMELTDLGVSRALLTCDPRNVGSVRVIEKNGRVLHDVRYVQSIRREVARYWIDLDRVDTP